VFRPQIHNPPIVNHCEIMTASEFPGLRTGVFVIVEPEHLTTANNADNVMSPVSTSPEALTIGQQRLVSIPVKAEILFGPRFKACDFFGCRLHWFLRAYRSSTTAVTASAVPCLNVPTCLVFRMVISRQPIRHLTIQRCPALQFLDRPCRSQPNPSLESSIRTCTEAEIRLDAKRRLRSVDEIALAGS
jgi:hypothetical protein